jgi:hypothetical protein
MELSRLSGLLIGLLLLCCNGNLLASEADELRERANAMRTVASVLADRGNMDEAERLKAEAAKLWEVAQRLELKDKWFGQPAGEKGARHPKERLEDLLAQARKLKESNASERELAQVREEIAQTERELDSLRAGRVGMAELPPEFRLQVEKLEAATRRIHHFRAAAENLKLAKAHDLARELVERAAAMERDVQGAKMQLAAEMQKRQGGEQMPDVIRDLRAEIERLRAEVKELRQRVETQSGRF